MYFIKEEPKKPAFNVAVIGHDTNFNAHDTDLLLEDIKKIFKAHERVRFYVTNTNEFENCVAISVGMMKRKFNLTHVELVYVACSPKKPTDLMLDICDEFYFPQNEGLPYCTRVNRTYEWVVDKADLIICNEDGCFDFGYIALEYALYKNKKTLIIRKNR